MPFSSAQGLLASAACAPPCGVLVFIVESKRAELPPFVRTHDGRLRRQKLSAASRHFPSSVIQILPVTSPWLKTSLSRAREISCETMFALRIDSRAPCE